MRLFLETGGFYAEAIDEGCTMRAGCGWDVHVGDMVVMADGRRGPVLETASIAGVVVCVNVGFDWYDAPDIVSWVPVDR